MKFEYDKEIDSGYIYRSYPIKKGEAEKQVNINDSIILDFDKEGKLLGIEILDASKIMRKKTFKDLMATNT